MKCEMEHERIVTAAYGELADEQAQELEQHLGDCPECAREQEQVLALKGLADAYPVLEPDANLIARSRQKLEAALDTLPPARWYERLGHRMLNNFASLQAAPVAACLLLVVGVSAGLLGGYQFAQNRVAHAGVTQTAQATRGQVQPAKATTVGVEAPAEIANISSIVRQPNSQMVPQRIEGSMDDPAIRQLLMLASENSASAGVRGNSVGLLAAECRAGRGCPATGIRDALMVALRYDKNAGVREKALEGLEPYVAEDMRVRDAVLQALMNDGDPHIRTAAINLLQPVEGDTSVRQVLHSVANTDRNPYIRTVSQQVLDSVPEIQ
jgi:hypothetical protein